MRFCDKMLALRKQRGWSQEELAARLGVSRQAVSKWESGQSLPDTERVLQLAELFGVSTDALLREDAPISAAGDAVRRRVSAEEAEAFLQVRRWASARIALGVSLCILSPICLILLGASPSAEVLRLLPGMGALLLLAAAAVGLFVQAGLRLSPYEYLTKEVFHAESGAEELARAEAADYRPLFVRAIVVGVMLCVASPLPIIAGSALADGTVQAALICLTLAVISVGVHLLVRAGIRWSSMQVLLQQGEYSARTKRQDKKRETFDTVYWLLVTAGYLAWSFAADAWSRSWIVWPVAGVLFAAFAAIYNAVRREP